RHAGLTFWILVPAWAALRVIWRPITAAAESGSTSPKNIAASLRFSPHAWVSKIEWNTVRAMPGCCSFPMKRSMAPWTQHISMNIAEKKQLYEGTRRILKVGGRFALADVVQRK